MSPDSFYGKLVLASIPIVLTLLGALLSRERKFGSRLERLWDLAKKAPSPSEAKFLKEEAEAEVKRIKAANYNAAKIIVGLALIYLMYGVIFPSWGLNILEPISKGFSQGYGKRVSAWFAIGATLLLYLVTAAVLSSAWGSSCGTTIDECVRGTSRSA